MEYKMLLRSLPFGCVHLRVLLSISIAGSVVYEHVQVELTSDILGLPYAEMLAQGSYCVYDIRAVADRHVKQKYASIVYPRRN